MALLINTPVQLENLTGEGCARRGLIRTEEAGAICGGRALHAPILRREIPKRNENLTRREAVTPDLKALACNLPKSGRRH